MNLSKLKAWWEKYEAFWILLGVVITIVGGVLGATAYIKSTAENAVLDERFLAKLSAKVRPSCILNSKGTVEADLGAMEYVTDFQIKVVPERYGFEILLTPNRHLAYPPQITSIDSDVVSSEVVRGAKYDWRILMIPQSTTKTLVTQDDMDTNQVYRFRIEILH